MRTDRKTNWLSYGGGVNSTALAILMAQGKVPGVDLWRIVFADTHDERPETYAFTHNRFVPWLRTHGKVLEVVSAWEGVLERWERLSVTGCKVLRSCSNESKIQPIRRHIQAHGNQDQDIQLIGIAADESHRAKERDGKRYPLVEMDIDRDGCIKIIEDTGLCVPIKSGCWHCPFMRVGEILTLAREHPERMARIRRLEQAAEEKFSGFHYQWKEKSADYWIKRAASDDAQTVIKFDEEDDAKPCACWDG